MKDFNEKEIAKLQNNLSVIRKAGGWTADEFGEMIGVTKQTISNLENKRTAMSKTQYIAIRTVLDYEIAKRDDNSILASTVNLYLNSDDVPEEDVKKAQAFIEGAKKTDLDKSALLGGLAALIGVAVAEALFAPKLEASVIAGGWLSEILRKKK